MKTPAAPTYPRVTWTLLALLPLALGSVARAADAAPAETKSYVLFMGADVEVQAESKLRPVKNVAGDAFVVLADNRALEVPMNRGPVTMRVTPQLKLSDKVATVTGLKVSRAYTPNADPQKKWAAQQASSAGMAAVGGSASRMASAMQGAQQAAINGGALAGASGVSLGGGSDVGNAVNSFNSASLSAGSDFNSAGYSAGQLQDDLSKELFDAVEVTCEVSAPHPMRDPYLILITNYRDKSEPGAEKSWIYAKALDRLDQNPLKVRLLQGGFPPGFEMLKTQFHIYGAGSELGSNVAEKNVTLSRDEAHQYIVIDHVVTHKGATLAPSLAMGARSADLRPRVSAETLQQTCYVKVDKDGKPQGAFRNEKCTDRFNDPAIESAVANTRFKPALNAGKPVEGVASLKLSELAI